jgi:hypothetical protein
MAKVPNKPLRERFNYLVSTNQITLIQLAEYLGWEDESKNGKRYAVSKVKRFLGLSPYKSHGKMLMRKAIDEQKAIELAKAMYLDPVDIGL